MVRQLDPNRVVRNLHWPTHHKMWVLLKTRRRKNLRTIKNKIRVWWAEKANKVTNNNLLQEVQHLEETANRIKRKQNHKSPRNRISHKLKAGKVIMFLRTTRIVVRLPQVHNQAPVQGLEAGLHQVVAQYLEQQAATLLLVALKYLRRWHIRANWLRLAMRVQVLRRPNQRARRQNLNPCHSLNLCHNRSQCPNHRVWWQVAITLRTRLRM